MRLKTPNMFFLHQEYSMIISPIERLIAEGKVVPMDQEKEKDLLEYLRLHYVPAAIKAERRNVTRAAEIRDRIIC